MVPILACLDRMHHLLYLQRLFGFALEYLLCQQLNQRLFLPVLSLVRPGCAAYELFLEHLEPLLNFLQVALALLVLHFQI